MSLTNINLAFLGISIIFYCLFAGADFGAGILEIFIGKKYQKEQRELITHAIAPVWEANHVWLVLAIVILFNGFPRAYSAISFAFHIPLVFLLVGVVFRGCAFTFRHYDPIKDRSQTFYNAIFASSSLVSPFFLGVIAGGITLGRAPLVPNEFQATYINPWFNSFCFSTGIFSCVLFTFLAAVYLIGEAREHFLRSIFIQRAIIANIFAVATGAVVFFMAERNGFSLLSKFFQEPIALGSMVLATLLLVPVWGTILRANVVFSRVLAACQMILILLGWFKLQYPSLVILDNHGTSHFLTYIESASPEATQIQLLYALCIGCLVIFPALFFLFKIFKTEPK